MQFTLDTSTPMATSVSDSTSSGATLTNVLLIEDNSADAKIVEILLEENDNINCRIDHQMTLGQGLEALGGDTDYAAVLLDMNLPDSRGFETLTSVLEKFPDDNIILLTGTKDREIGFKAVELGAQDYLVKGDFDSEQLGKSLRFSIERKKAIRRLAQMQRLAQIGNWEFRPNDEFFFASPEAMRIIGSDGSLNLFDEVQQPGSPLHVIYKWYMAKDSDTHAYEEEISFELNGVKRFALLEGTCAKLDGRPTCQGIIHDITDKRVGEELRKVHELSQRSAKMKEQFVASISHEMRTPMNAILGMSNILSEMELEEEQQGLVSSIKQSSEILLGVVNDILEISTLQNGKIVFEDTSFDINDLVDNLFNVMQYKLDEKDLMFVRKMPEELSNILIGDKLRLNQVLYNLVGNSIKFTDSGTVGLQIDVLEKTDTDVNLKFSVTDTGIGIPEDKVETVFGSFTRVRTKDRIFEGTGLGLSIAKNIVEQLDGEIGASSVLSEGSTFFFTMRFGIGSADAQAAPPTERKYEIDTSRTIRLLLAEDHKMNQLVARKTLERAFPNIDLTIVDNGQLAVEALQANIYDMVLMDIQMPVMDGYEAAVYVREHVEGPMRNVPILAMTAHAHISKDKQYLQYGMQDFVLKPFDPKQLFSKIAQYAQA